MSPRDSHTPEDRAELAECNAMPDLESWAADCEARWHFDAILNGAGECEDNFAVCQAAFIALTDDCDFPALIRLVFGRSAEADAAALEAMRERVRAAMGVRS